MVPVQLRAGGAFMALALVLAIYAIVAFIRGQGVFTFTPSVLLVLVASAIFGSFATVSKTQQSSRTQVIALGTAVALIVASVFVPDVTVIRTETFWLLMWAAAAVVCALVLRRSTAPTQ